MTGKINKFGTASIELHDVHTTIAIPLPVKLEQRFGIASLNKSGEVLSIRVHEDDATFMAEVAAAMGMSRSGFIRWCAVFAAQEIHRKRTGQIVRVNP